MNWLPKQLGSESKGKIAVLGGLGLVLVYLVWSNVFSGGSSTQPAPAPQAHAVSPYAQVPPDGPPPTASAEPARKANAPHSSGLEDFKPSMKRARLLAKDPTQVDPTLRLDLLARLQNAKFEGDMRSLFEFSQAALPPIKEPKQIHPGPVRAFGPQPLPPPQVYVPPPPPAIPLKFYGFVNPLRPDVKSAFFLDGEDIIVASEGQTIRNRYRIIRIGVNSAVVEDLQYKNQQPLPLVAEEQG